MRLKLCWGRTIIFHVSALQEATYMPFIIFLLQFGHLPDVTDLGRLDKSGLKVSCLGQVLVLQCVVLVQFTVACYASQC